MVEGPGAQVQRQHSVTNFKALMFLTDPFNQDLDTAQCTEMEEWMRIHSHTHTLGYYYFYDYYTITNGLLLEKMKPCPLLQHG